MTQLFDSIKKSLTFIKNDLSKFSEVTAKNIELIEEKLNIYSTKNSMLANEKDSLTILIDVEKKIIQNVKFVLQSVSTELQYKHSLDTKKLYFGNTSIGKVTENLKNITLFCNKLLKKNEDKDKHELANYVSQIEEIKNEVENHIKSKEVLKAKIKTDSDNLSKIFIELKDIFNILKTSIKYDSISNKSINYNLYFPSVKIQKKDSQLILVDQMNFDIFKKLSDLPDELKTGAIYNEWNKELQNLFYKKRESELNSINLADKFIINKHKKSE